MRVGFGYDIHQLKAGRFHVFLAVFISNLNSALMVIPMRMFSFMH